MIRLVKQEQHIQLVDIIDDDHTTRYIDCSFKFILKVGVDCERTTRQSAE
jgi:hypothetical protein